MSADERIIPCPDCGKPCHAFRERCDVCSGELSSRQWVLRDGRTGSLMDLIALVQAEA